MEMGESVRACARKNFHEEVEDNHLRFVGPTLAVSLFFGAKKAKKWRNPIRFLPPLSLFFPRFFRLSPSLAFLYGQIRLPAVGIITESKGGGGGVGCCLWLFCFASE